MPTCQLCHAAVGILEHRFMCSASLPADGWKQPPQEAHLARRRTGKERLRNLELRGLLVLRLPAPPPDREEWFEWMVCPPEHEDAANFTWYLDGSLLDGGWVDYRATGFGIVVVDPDGALVGYGSGCPPTWCATAAAAETWALATALTLTAFPPKIRTDCQSLLTIAEEGTNKALGADKPLARAWTIIAAALDGDVASLIRDGRLAWLPAHQAMGAIGVRRLSNGRRMTAIDWRANRLVDALAKLAAAMRQAPMAVLRMLRSGDAAVRHAAALLGEVTHAANNHRTVVTKLDGSQVEILVRDAQPKDVSSSKVGAKPKASLLQPLSAEAPVLCSSSQLASLDVQWGRQPARSSVKAARAVAKRRRAEDEAATRRRVEEIASACIRPTCPDGPLGPTASDRRSGVRERVLARLAGQTA